MLEIYSDFINNVKPAIPVDSRIQVVGEIQPFFLEYKYPGYIGKSSDLLKDIDYLVLTRNMPVWRINGYDQGAPWPWKKEEYEDFTKKITNGNTIVYNSKNLIVVKMRN